MIPSRILIASFILPALLSLATIWLPDLLRPLLLLDGAIVAVALFDRLLSRPVRAELEWDLREVLSIGHNNPAIVRLIQNQRRRVRVRLRPQLPTEIVCTELGVEGERSFSLDLLASRETSLRFHLRPNRRGAYELGRWVLRQGSLLGMWTLQSQVGQPFSVRVYPDLAMIRTYELLARQQRQYALVRTTKRRGGEHDFARLRDYTQDDDPRHIDWKATARRQRLTTREFQLQSDQNILFVLDAGRLMTAFTDGMSQFDHALNASLLLAHVAARGGDRVGLVCFDEEVRSFVLPKTGGSQVGRLVQETYSLHPRLRESSYQRALSTIGLRLKQRGLIVLFTQLIDPTAVEELSAQLRLLSRRHLPLVVILDDPDLERLAEVGSIDSSEAVRGRRPTQGAPSALDTASSLYASGAAAELLTWKQEAVHALEASGAHVLQCPPRRLTERTVNRYLEIKMQGAL